MQYSTQPSYPMTRPPRRRRPADKLSIILAVAIVLAVVSVLVTGFILLYNLIFSGGKAAASSNPNGGLLNQLPSGKEYTSILQEENGPASKTWDGSSRVNVLVFGLDARPDSGDESARTDSIMVLSMDPASRSAAMLSLPRDLWVPIPGNGEGKINTAYFTGLVNGGPGEGARLAVATVEGYLGVPINYYISVDWDAFIKFVDAIGGLDIDVPYEITIDPVGPGNTMFLKPGVQTLNGEAALAYARARSSDGGDFDRARRQQKVLLAVRDNVLNFFSLSKLIANSPSLYQTMKEDVRTNMTLREAAQLALAASQIPEDRIRRRVLLENVYVYSSVSWDGAYILLPYEDKVRALINDFFYNPDPFHDAKPTQVPAPAQPTGNASPQQPPSAADQPAQVRVHVMNGSGVQGLAGRTADYLAAQGYIIDGKSTASTMYDLTEIHINADLPNCLANLAATLNVPVERIFNEAADDTTSYQILVILGQDWGSKNTLP